MAGKSTVKKKSKIVIPVVEAKKLEHVLVPDVDVASEAELKELVDVQGITRDKLPLINSADPAIAFLKLSPGNVVKFTRRSLVTGTENAYYRLVVGV
ncbi:MAG: DNA-directed RNA polymerase subunit RpoH/Rpb5 C-terminal domain-containing protein [Candidatus Micrarchaeota archaeon]